eukprot:jgi/Picsp_1/1062/NSC_04545-R1_---NA---
MADIWQYITPDAKSRKQETTAARAKGILSKCSTSAKNSGSRQPTSKLKKIFCLVPWLSILSWAFFISGLALYAVNSKGAHDQALSIFSAIEVDKSTYLNRINAILSSYIITIALGVGCLSVSCVAAVINIRHVVSGRQWNRWKSFSSITFYALSLFYCLSCTIWFLIVTIGVTSWATCLWILERATTVTIKGMEAGVAAPDNCTQSCLQLGQFPFLGTVKCVCETESLQSVQAMSLDAKSKCHWLIAGLMCALIGSMLHLIILGADLGSVYSSQTQEVNKSDGNNLVENVDFVLPSHPPTLTPGSTQIRSRSLV